MKRQKKSLRIIILALVQMFFVLNSMQAQYQLKAGEKYFLRQEILQNTKSDNMNVMGNVSLDVKCRLDFTVLRASMATYRLSCSYSDLSLSFFSPSENLSVSSENNDIGHINTMLKKLRGKVFFIEFDPSGTLHKIEGLDSLFYELKSSLTPGDEVQSIVMKTIEEAFGVKAFTGLWNTAMNHYSEQDNSKIEKVVSITFNARSLDILNTYYIQMIKGKKRVQGIGVIDEVEESFRHDEVQLETLLKGNQTYDFLVEENSGWLLEGISKQKIHSLSSISGHENLPEKLKIPSITETEISFKGGLLNETN